ncbi:MAG: DUF342 domain-containing protein [Spirochaetaceae bacterium]|nr:MAG: DUF342 domain-containing protein [Spirochaetaceae bacterium]
MDGQRTDANDKIIKTTEQLLNEVSHFSEKLNTDNTEPAQMEAKTQVAESVRKSLGINDDGYLDIKVSVDSMKAIADFYPPLGNGKPIREEDVIAQLKQKRIKSGVLGDAIKEAINLCNTTKKQNNNVLIARGKIPVDEVPAHYVIEETLLLKDQIDVSQDEEVDFKERSPFTLVSKGRALAKKIPAREGEFGYNVFGSSLSYAVKRIPKIMSGANVRTENDVYVATCDGLFRCKGSLFWVDEVLFIDADVDYKTGHIDFPGDILIKGLVKDGFKINGGRSILCQSTLDASEVFCKGDLVVQNGIIGKKEGIVRIGGRIKAKFIENCNVEAQGIIEIKKSIINSNVNTLDKILLGDRGIIIGGIIYAQIGIEVQQIGSESGSRTEIYCGMDFMVQKKLEWIKKKNIELFMKQKEIQNRIDRGEKEGSKLAILAQSLKEAIDKLNEKAKILLFHLDKYEDAKIIVRGVVYPGTIIEICHVRYPVSHILPRVIFTLNKRKGKIEIRTF